jgi:hypothetical protein
VPLFELYPGICFTTERSKENLSQAWFVLKTFKRSGLTSQKTPPITITNIN